ncbi:hypothetical protein LCGC14_1030630 [marine sediment metagenome]|uniref:Uncharacterized protein n=1 Tax=marine sediment metagenome TaxID=412755 RepID=A0A0F9MZ97_9ZZZZ
MAGLKDRIRRTPTRLELLEAENAQLQEVAKAAKRLQASLSTARLHPGQLLVDKSAVAAMDAALNDLAVPEPVED